MFSSEVVKRSHQVIFVGGLFDSCLHLVLFGHREDVFTSLFVELRDDVRGAFTRRRDNNRISSAHTGFTETNFKCSHAFRSREVADENSHTFSISMTCFPLSALSVRPGLTFGELEAGGGRVIWIQSSSILRFDCIQKTLKQ